MDVIDGKVSFGLEFPKKRAVNDKKREGLHGKI